MTELPGCFIKEDRNLTKQESTSINVTVASDPFKSEPLQIKKTLPNIHRTSYEPITKQPPPKGENNFLKKFNALKVFIP